MKDRPILFSGPMVRAILDGRKTVTRRAVKPQPNDVIDGEPYWHIGGFMAEHYRPIRPNRPGREKSLRCPYGDRGDRLWVRETWAAAGGRYVFRADVNDGAEESSVRRIAPELAKANPWRPSIYMPRAASRLTLEVVSVRVERLQEMTEEDCIAECVVRVTKDNRVFKFCVYDLGDDMSTVPWQDMPRTARECFAPRWDAINGHGSWAANPWVWVIEFRRLP